jgi:hypothetical protein
MLMQVKKEETRSNMIVDVEIFFAICAVRHTIEIEDKVKLKISSKTRYKKCTVGLFKPYPVETCGE